MLNKTLTPQQYIKLATDDRITVKREDIDNQPFPPTHLAIVTYPDGTVELYEFSGGREEWQQVGSFRIINRENNATVTN